MPEAADPRAALAPLPARPNPAQRAAVEETVAIYEANPEVALLEWRVIDPAEFLREGQRPGGIYIEFLYRAHAEDPDLRPGREVTVFGEDGSVLDSQDFG